MANDLQHNAEMFVASERLKAASEALEGFLEAKVLDTKQIATLKWAGEIIREVNWTSEDYNPSKSLCVLATSSRPKFYRTLLNMEYVPTTDFLDRLPLALISEFKEPILNREEISIGARLMGKMSEYIFSELQAESRQGRM